MSLVSLAVAVLLCESGQSPKLKPAPKQAKTAPTLGTVQLPGDNGKVGVTYQLGPKRQELHFTLDSAAVAMNFSAPGYSVVAGESERVLILNFTVQNPQKKEVGLSSTTFGFTAVSPDDENFKFKGTLLSLPRLAKIYQSLKPAQKIKCVVAFPIFATGPVLKVMVNKGNAPILRYDLSGKLTKMQSAFSKDGFDLDQTTKFPELLKGETADIGEYGVTNNGWEFTSEKIKGRSPAKGYKYLVIKTGFRNLVAKDAFLSFSQFEWTVGDDSGQKFNWNREILFESSEKSIYQYIAFGENEVKGRVFFQVPETMTSFSASLTHISSQRKVKLQTN
jgi:hypothetical protein